MQAAILISAMVLPFGYWWYITVPEARLALSKDKRLEGSETRNFVLDLAETPQDERRVEKWFFAKWLRQAKPRREREPSVVEVAEPATPVAEGDTSQPSLRELFTPASLSGNATPKFFSGDNPIVVTMGALFLLSAFATALRFNAALMVDVLLLGVAAAFGASRLTLK